ncbi:MAG: deoxyguanosinetriphosphate triphosphohydrolase [Candidatus Sumerlaeaceae bacterium]|nr:deoxyguanosinetriphosphate triphosphohydrolase [Candidatus Sumerlaeaceae bacterium]
MLKRADLEQLERQVLAPYAMKSADTRGRDYPITPDELRTEFQRDRDRIIHSTAFRKLEYKTQVYMVHYGDYFRTRLTHTMEVAQIARTLARNLRLNADLTEAIALAHDLGHTPFGHSGEAALKRLLADQGGFEHNEQGLRVVEYLEERYPDVPGLNLTWEVREGIIKHDTEYDSPNVPERFKPEWAPTLEAQVCDVADEIAYNNHDIDDALKMGLISIRDLKEVDWVWEIFERAQKEIGDEKPEKFVKYRAIGTLIDMQVADALQTTVQNIRSFNIQSVADVRQCRQKIVTMSQEMLEKNRCLKDFLMRRVYRHPYVVRMATKAERFVEKMFLLYRDTPEQLPLKYQARIERDGLVRVIVDYLSGMTDRYLLDEYIKAFEPEEKFLGRL